MRSILTGLLKRSPHRLRPKMMKPVLGKIVEGINQVRLPFEIIEFTNLLSNTKWNDPETIAISAVAGMIPLLAGPYVVQLASSPRQAISTLHFWWQER